MPYERHDFTEAILEILEKNFPGKSGEIFEKCELIRYLNKKTRAASRGSKARAGFANHYAIYVLVEDYLSKGFSGRGSYKKYEGAKFTDLFRRQRELPFGEKLQNHALNHRLNEEYRKFFPGGGLSPIIRDPESERYWINERLIRVKLLSGEICLARSIKEIIEAYIAARKKSFSEFMEYCGEIFAIQRNQPEKAVEFIQGLLRPNVDARIFEIVSFAILKQHYSEKRIFWGWSPDELLEESLTLYKTGRTNANDGGIDFVMKPLGRFFQVTETVDAGKYFLDIDKIQRYPVTFVVKTNDPDESILRKIRQQAEMKYQIQAIVEKYIEAIEEIINIPKLIEIFRLALERGAGGKVINEIVIQSKVEFNVDFDDANAIVSDESDDPDE